MAMDGSLDELVGIQAETPPAEKKAQASQEILRLYEEMIATKNAWLLRLFVCLCVVTFAFLFVVIFDLMTGFHRWSFNYLIPALCSFSMIVIASIAATGHRSIENYIIYMVVSAVFSMVPVIFLLTGWTTVLWPTVLTAAASVIYLAALVLFIGKDTWSELKKRLHL